jgi:dGTPase
LKLNEDLTEAIALAHDLGHTPFGHAGQDALNECMKDFGGFEHNLQSLRVVDWLEERYAEFPGLNLTFETREGVLKHCAPKKAAELGELGRRFLEKRQPGLEAQLANVADEIAYNNHDVDDGLRAGLITVAQLREVRLFAGQYDAVIRRYPDLPSRRVIYETVRRMIGQVVTDLIEETARRIADARVHSIEDVRHQLTPLVAYTDPVREQTLELKRFLRQNLYQHESVKRVTDGSVRFLKELFQVFMEDTRRLPPQYQDKLRAAAVGDEEKARVVADYVAGMTDRYALREHARLTGSGLGP